MASTTPRRGKRNSPAELGKGGNQLKDHDPLDEGTRSSWSSYLISGALLACLFFFFAIISVRLAATVMKDVSTATPLKKYQKITRLDPFDETAWNTLGRIYYYLGKNKKAGEALTKALSLNCLYYPAWINVMWLSIQTKQAAPEHITQRVRVIDLLNPRDFSIHWKILMRMLTIDAPWARTVALNEIKVLLTLQGSNKGQLFQLAEMILGDDHRLISFVPDEKNIKTPLLSYFLYRKKDPDLALNLWEELVDRGWEDKRLFHTMIRGLFYNRRYAEAYLLWRKHFNADDPHNFIFNGGFEKDFLKFGFAWRTQRKPKGLRRARFIHFFKAEGRRAFTMSFDGEHNPRVINPYQYLYLEPGTYRLTASIATEDLTSASGFYLEFSGPHIRVLSKRLTGDTPWTRLELSITLTQAGLYRVSLRRDATSKLNRFLGGKVFLDDVALIRTHE